MPRMDNAYTSTNVRRDVIASVLSKPNNTVLTDSESFCCYGTAFGLNTNVPDLVTDNITSSSNYWNTVLEDVYKVSTSSSQTKYSYLENAEYLYLIDKYGDNSKLIDVLRKDFIRGFNNLYLFVGGQTPKYIPDESVVSVSYTSVSGTNIKNTVHKYTFTYTYKTLVIV